MTKQEALQISLWAKAEAAKVAQATGVNGTLLLDRDLLDYWKRERPKMVASLGMLAATNLAIVLTDRMLDAETENKAAGMPWTDAREQAEQDWLLREPEAETPADRLLSLAA